ncbi:Extracellular matrix protein fras1, variant 2 [Chamberlinius hualienensis]
MVEFEKLLYEIQELRFNDRSVNISIKILRSGDTSKATTVRVIVFGNDDIDSQSYHPKTILIRFDEQETLKLFYIKLLYNSKLKFMRPALTLQLVTEDLTNAGLGTLTKCTVIIVGRNLTNSVFPAPPVVMSLSFETNFQSALDKFRSPSYPLICITSCNPLYYDYNKTKTFCDNNRVNISSVNYFWEIQLPSSTSQFQKNEFQILTRKTLISNVDSSVLDPVYFRPGFLVRCVVRPVLHPNILGLVSRSKEIEISSDGYCGSSSNSTIAMPFIATLSYIDANDYSRSNLLKVQVDIPHQDGMVPVISTKELHNLNLLLNDEITYRKHHLCSNLILPGELESVDPNSLFLNPQNGFYQHDKRFIWNTTGNANGTLFYTHLNMERCLWRFTAYFSMSDLIRKCGGVVSNSLIEVGSKKQTIVRVPLHVANVFSSGNTWTSYEYQTEMEVSFNYESVLLPSVFETNGDVEAYLHINRIYLDGDGKLIIDFQTKPKFNGLFVMKHKSNSNISSNLKFLKFNDLHFNLYLRWTAKSNDKPIQSWRASSFYSLNNYSGNYVLELIPCILTNNPEITKMDILSMCICHKPKRLFVKWQISTIPFRIIVIIKV